MTDATPRKLIVTTWEGGGSVGPALTMARKLVSAGHDVRIMSDACNRPEAEATGARFIAWTNAPSRTDKSRESEILKDYYVEGAAATLDHVFSVITVGPALDYARDIMAEIEREKPELVISSELTFGVALGCEASGQNFALFACNSLAFPLAGAPLAGPNRVSEVSPEEEQQQADVLAEIGAVFERHLPAMNASRKALGLGPIENLVQQLDLARKVLIGVSQTFDFGENPQSARFAYVGPQLDESAWAQEWHAPWKDSTKKRVLVSFSTTFQDHHATLQRVIDAVSKLPVEALVTLGPSIAAEEMRGSANVHLLTSAPHNQVMPQVDLIITHGGHGTVARAMVNHLPMLVIPHGRDQNDNADRIVAHEAGLTLSPTAGEGAIASALKELLSNPAFTRSARLLGNAVSAECDQSQIVQLIEDMCCPEFA